MRRSDSLLLLLVLCGILYVAHVVNSAFSSCSSLDGGGPTEGDGEAGGSSRTRQADVLHGGVEKRRTLERHLMLPALRDEFSKLRALRVQARRAAAELVELGRVASEAQATEAQTRNVADTVSFTVAAANARRPAPAMLRRECTAFVENVDLPGLDLEHRLIPDTALFRRFECCKYCVEYGDKCMGWSLSRDARVCWLKGGTKLYRKNWPTKQAPGVVSGTHADVLGDCQCIKAAGRQTNHAAEEYNKQGGGANVLPVLGGAGAAQADATTKNSHASRHPDSSSSPPVAAAPPSSPSSPSSPSFPPSSPPTPLTAPAPGASLNPSPPRSPLSRLSPQAPPSPTLPPKWNVTHAGPGEPAANWSKDQWETWAKSDAAPYATSVKDHCDKMGPIGIGPTPLYACST